MIRAFENERKKEKYGKYVLHRGSRNGVVVSNLRQIF